MAVFGVSEADRRGFRATASASQRGRKYFTKFPLAEHQKMYEPPSESGWTEGSRRTGVVALKCGMMPDWDSWGRRHPLTVLKLENVQVTQVKTEDVHGFNAVQVGAGDAKPKRVTQPMMGHFESAGVPPKIVLAEFPVTEDALLEVGTEISARHFVPGQHVDVQGVTKGKGFAGVMKRWGFSGQRATHGVSKTHRHPGSTGQSQGPGKVWKGKKMSGNMGNKRRTVQNLLVYKIDIKRNLVFVRGCVPGYNGSYVRISDTIKTMFDEETMPPFPTYIPTEEDKEMLRKWEAGEYVHSLARGGGGDGEPEPPFEIVSRPTVVNPFAMREDEPEIG